MSTVGVLGLQGAFGKHTLIVRRLGENIKDVRYPDDLDECDSLIIPGGESTTITKLIDFIGIRDALLKFSETKPILGTCAGLILMAKNVHDPKVKSLKLIDISVDRNAYGRQVDSFSHPLKIEINGYTESIPGIFIRAPRIRNIGQDVEVLASLNGEPVFVKQGIHIATSFHPELSDDLFVHKMLVEISRTTVDAV